MSKYFKHPAFPHLLTSEEKQGIERALAFRAGVVLNPFLVEIDDYLRKRKIADSLDKLFEVCDDLGKRLVIKELTGMFEEVVNEI